jgi:DUF4097 and DUF4098 domain-containing protein YvlB
MRRITFLSLALFLLASLQADAEEWKKQFTISGKPTLRVEANDADLIVRGWDQKEVEARVFTEGYKLGPEDVRVTERQSGDEIELDVHTPRLHGLTIRNHSVRVEVSLPREADLKLHTGDGNIRLDNIKGELRLESGDGELDVRSADGRLNAETRDGNIRVGGRFDGLDLDTGDGNIDAALDKGSKITSGWTLRTGDGNVRLRVPEDLTADVDARTGDGRVSVDLPISVNGGMKEKSVRGKLNGGGPTLELRTGDGNIDVEKS